ncbi:MAG: 5-amino-6-(D-ribitylamino)uracil--L-tyrosine 4-hydroxyphenyl transferase CofH [Myxococcota bacterium]
MSDREIRTILDGVLNGRELAVDDAVRLCTVNGPELHALMQTADELRRQQVGDDVGYVINRNINFTNVCIKGCRFCAFSRTRRSEEGYFLDTDEIVRRAKEAHDYGATEVCIQGGLAPGQDPDYYVDLVQAVKAAVPALHVHAFSPEEVKFGAELRGVSIAEFIVELKEAGVDSLPGTAAEVFDDGVRDKIAPGRITTAEWTEVIRAAHAAGVPTTATLMHGHIENDLQRMRHLDYLRRLQSETGGFTEFVPLSFVHEEAPMHMRRLLPSLRPGPTANEVTRLYAIARLMLGATFRNIQVSWVKEGVNMAQAMLSCGANDLGGTLINESISTSAGARHGQFQSPASLRRIIREAGRVPVERDTRYRTLRRFSGDHVPDEETSLDRVSNPDATFGSYSRLIEDNRFRFHLPVATKG